jgi:hypothetical protein
MNATGLTVTFASGFCANIKSIDMPDMVIPEIDTTDFSSANTAMMQSSISGRLAQFGKLTLTIAFDPNATPPISADAGTVTIAFPDGPTFTFIGYMSAYKPGTPMEQEGTANVQISVGSLVSGF